MWQMTHTREFAGLRKEQVWMLWADVDNWHRWDEDIEYARLLDPFEAGARFELKPKHGPKVSLKVVRAEPLRGFTDLVEFPLARMYSSHDMQDTATGLKLISSVRVEGALAWLWRKLVAEKVAAGMPAQMDSLARLAAGRAA